MNRACRILIGIFGLAYVAALALLVIGTLGLFGQPRDPLAAVFLLPLGLPWNRMLGIFPEPFLPWLAAAAPLLNLAILAGLCRMRRAARR